MASAVRIDRRQVLKGAGAIGVGVLAALAPATALADASEAETLLGSWNGQQSFETGPFAGAVFNGTFTFAPGGALIGNNAGAPTTGLGNWAKHGDDRFQFTFHQFVGFVPPPVPGVPRGSKIRVRGQGSLDGDMIRGRFSFDTVGPDGKPLPVTGSGTFQGTRIRIEAL
jgi:hypothetical protein